jgi:hypothetical protein
VTHFFGDGCQPPHLPASWPPGPVDTLPAVTPYLVARIGRRLHDLASHEDCPYRQDIADAANALLGREPDPGSPWYGRPLPAEPDTVTVRRDDLRLLLHGFDHPEDTALGSRPDERWQRMQHPDLVPVAEKYWRSVLARFLAASPAVPETALRERLAEALLDQWAGDGGPGCNGEPVPWAEGPAYDLAETVMGVLSAAPPEREPDWAADGSRDSVWVIGERVVQRGPDQTVLLDGERVEDPLALAAALRCATHSTAAPPEREAPNYEEVINRVSLTVTPGGTFREIARDVVDDLIGRGWLTVREGSTDDRS